MRYLFPQVGVRRLQKLLHLPSKVPAHFRRAHAAQGAKCQALHILCAVIKVTADGESNGSRNYQEEARNWGGSASDVVSRQPNSTVYALQMK